MNEFSEECLITFLRNQEQLFPEPVAETVEEAEAFLEDCMAVVVDTLEEVKEYFEENGKKYHHIIDSNTGYPSDSDLTSVTIICADGTTADALSTSLFIMGKEKAAQFYKSTDIEFDMILVDSDKNVYISEGIKDLFTSDYNVTVVNK